jgi:hypothetical protein
MFDNTTQTSNALLDIALDTTTAISTQPTIDPLDISFFLQDGFKKFVDVKLKPDGSNKWLYYNQHADLYDPHRSWVYAITLNNKVVKIGESGNPLGIKVKKTDGYQPRSGTECRFGRLAHFDVWEDGRPKDTDTYIRVELKPLIEAGNMVSIYAKLCDIIKSPASVMGLPVEVDATAHKSYEQHYLHWCKNKTGDVPWLNKGLK